MTWLTILIKGGVMYLAPILANLETDEGFSGKVYKCPAGYLTIGFGKNLEAEPLSIEEIRLIFEKQPMTKDQARILLSYKVTSIVEDLNRVLGDSFKNAHPDAQGVLVNMTYNLGLNGILKFKTSLECFKKQKYSDMARNLEKSLWYKQVGNRSKRLVKILDSIGNKG